MTPLPARPSPTVPPRTTRRVGRWWVFPPSKWSGQRPDGQSDSPPAPSPRSLHAAGRSQQQRV